jgi:hypothetical protein
MNPETGRTFDDIKPMTESIDSVIEENCRNIFEENACRLFPRLKIPRCAEAASKQSSAMGTSRRVQCYGCDASTKRLRG